MRTTDRIGFKLIIEEPDVEERTVVVCPRYEGLTLKWSKDSGTVYHAFDVEGSVSFWGIDFRTVARCDLRTKFTLVIFYKGKGEVARSEFRKTDCKWDMDNETCDVDVSVWDAYKKLEDSKDNEYNLVRLPIDKKTICFYVYPQNQIYFQEDEIISLFGYEGSQASVGMTHDHEKLSSITDSMWFSSEPVFVAMLKVNGQHSTFVVTKEMFDQYNPEKVWVGNFLANNVRVLYSGISNLSVGISYSGNYSNAKFCIVSTGDMKYSPSVVTNFSNKFTDALTPINDLYSKTSGSYSYFYNNVPQTIVYECRLTLAYWGTATMKELTGLEIPSYDLTANFAHNMRYRTPTLLLSSTVASAITPSTRTSPVDKGYGRVENTNQYYDTPLDDPDYNWLPVKKDAWFDGHSLWIQGLNVSDTVRMNYRQQTKVDDFYALGDAIKAVVNEIDPNIVFEPDTAHSLFLFSAINPVSGMSQKPMYISQKSNVLNLGYDYPAWQAPITWGKIVTLLKNAFGCYYDLYEPNGDGVKHLRIEHLDFYMNGGYDASVEAPVVDLTQIYRSGTQHTFAEGTNNWQWDTEGNGLHSSANRYEYGWMDTQSVIFDGYTIVVPEEYRLFEGDRAEERKVDWFSSDIDFLTAVQAECSSDGFVIVMEDLTNSGWIISGNPNYSGQNYELSLEYLQKKYLKQGIYAEKIKIGDQEPQNNAVTVRMRKGAVEFAMPERRWCEATNIIRTAVGNGAIDTLTFNMHSEQWTAELRYSNE